MRTALDCVKAYRINEDTKPYTEADILETLQGLIDASQALHGDIRSEADALEWLTELLHFVLTIAVMYDWPIDEVFADLHVAKMAKVSSINVADTLADYRHRTHDHRKRDFLQHLERKWLARHPRLYDALTLQNQKLMDSVCAKLAQSPETEAVMENRLRAALSEVGG